MTKKDDKYSRAPVAETYLCEGAPHDSRAALAHTAHLWTRWSGLTESVKTGKPAPRAGEGPKTVDAFIAAMHKNATQRAPMVVGSLDLAGVKRVLDVGGGSGAYSIALCRASAEIMPTVLDLPGVLPLTARYVEEAGLTGRIELVEGDFHADSLGTGYDLVLLSAICHMNSPQQNIELLRRCRAALGAGGRVVIQDFLLNDDRTGHPTAALFALNMLVNTNGGNSYSVKEYTQWLESSGFSGVKRLPLPGPTGIVVASAT